MCARIHIPSRVTGARAAQESWDKVFGGAGFVPDVPSLQAWLECAWQLGFDPDGAKQLRHHVQVCPVSPSLDEAVQEPQLGAVRNLLKFR